MIRIALSLLVAAFMFPAMLAKEILIGGSK